MTTATLAPETYLPADPPATLAELGRFLADHAGERPGGSGASVHLVGETDGVELPAQVLQVLQHIVDALAAGRAVTVAPQSMLLTTQQTADLLGVSRPTIVRVVDAGDLPAERVGNRRRVLLSDALAYRDRRRQAQYDMLAATAVDLDEEDDPATVRERLRTARQAATTQRRVR